MPRELLQLLLPRSDPTYTKPFHPEGTIKPKGLSVRSSSGRRKTRKDMYASTDTTMIKSVVTCFMNVGIELINVPVVDKHTQYILCTYIYRCVYVCV